MGLAYALKYGVGVRERVWVYVEVEEVIRANSALMAAKN